MAVQVLLRAVIANALSILIGLFGGGIITFVVARYYYVKASKDLLEETKRLRAIVNLLSSAAS